MKAVTVFLALAVVSAAGFRGRRQSGYRFPPQGFRSSPDSEEEVERNTLIPSLLHRQNIEYRAQEGPRPRPQEYQQGKRPLLSKNQSLKEEELEEEEKEEPDRLTLLLPQSKFNCQGKGTGYYADEGLSCEVFHYCQDNARHSWICPEGFLFHQVHLICMPPSSDNICTQSSQYHFVNEYLYKPINAEEAERKPNVTLRYSERYYPETFYREEDVNRQHEAQQEVVHQARPVLRQPNQVFHSPEEVNIPLQHRRPQHPPQRGYSAQSSAEYEY